MRAIEEDAEAQNRKVLDVIRDALMQHYSTSERWRSIKDLLLIAYRMGATNEQGALIVRKKLAAKGTTMDATSAAWYRSQLRIKYPDLPSGVEARNNLFFDEEAFEKVLAEEGTITKAREGSLKP